MLQVELKPDQLAEMAAVYDTRVLTVEYDEAQSALLAHSALAMLRPNEFKLVLALLRQRQVWQQAIGRVPIGLSIPQLCSLIGSTSADSVCKQLNRAALRVTALGIHIYPLHGENSYFVLFAPEIGKQPRDQAERSLPISVVP